MKKRRLPKSIYLPIALFLLLILIPGPIARNLKSFAAAVSAPLWQGIGKLKNHPEAEAEIHQLKTENEALKNEFLKIKNILSQEIKILKLLSSRSDSPHSQTLEKRLEQSLSLVPAKVIYRSPRSWGSSIWIDVGQLDNRDLKSSAIARNSPVVIDDALVGVIDYVGKKQSRVRLITDAGLSPSVRVARGDPKKEMLKSLLNSLSALIGAKDLNEKELENFDKALKILGNFTEAGSKNVFLAKGIIQGRSLPLWRSPGQKLKGIGFNYDFSDEDGKSRDLATGTESLVEAGDLLVTTGYDGVFPANLKVGIVDSVSKLKEGDYFYELTAIPSVFDLDHLDIVFVLPPLGFDPEDQPPLLGK